MIEIGARLSELEALGLSRRTRLVSGPQGPRVVLDGKPTLSLCSANYLGLADHPDVREAAAEAALRWGAGAAASRVSSGTMTIHRRLEERLADFVHRQSGLLFGSGYLAAIGIIGALARPGDVVFADELSHASTIDACRLTGAELFLYDHCDPGHLAWGIAKAAGRGALIVTESVFATGGDLAPLEEIVALAERRHVRLVVDESHGIGAAGPGGRGILAEAGLEHQADVIVGSLSTSLGSYGAFVACDREMGAHLLNAARTLIFSTASAPSAAAAALAALTLLEQRPQLVTRLGTNTDVLRRALEREGFGAGGQAQIVSIHVGAAELAERIASAAFEQRVLIDAVRPPAVPAAAAYLHLAAMASHRPEELEDAARRLALAARARGFEPELSALAAEVVEFETAAPAGAPRPAGVFDVEQVDRLAA